LEAEPERAVAIATYVWAKLPALIGPAVDLTDQQRVQAIVRRVDQVELSSEPSPSTGSAAGDPAPTST